MRNIPLSATGVWRQSVERFNSAESGAGVADRRGRIVALYYYAGQYAEAIASAVVAIAAVGLIALVVWFLWR